MKRVLTLLALLSAFVLASSAPQAAAMLGAENNYTKALKRATDENKIVLMVVVKEHCRWCDRLVERTLSNPDVKSYVRNNYTLLIVDRFDNFPEAFDENFYPAIFFVDPRTQKSLYENIGYVKVNPFLEDLKTIHSLYAHPIQKQ